LTAAAELLTEEPLEVVVASRAARKLKLGRREPRATFDADGHDRR
jgi:hypothetical protein